MHLLETNHWLRDRRNVRVLRLTSPAYENASYVDAQHMTPEASMRSWDVDALVAFFKEKDASGIAKVMLDNSVNGADLLLYTEPRFLQADLRMTPFAARKALQVRDLYLGRV